MSYKHGVTIQEKSTSLLTPKESMAGLPVAIGTAPINAVNNLSNVNKPILCYSYDEAVKAFGNSDDFTSYTLSEVIDSHFRVFSVAPLVLINVLDPNIHLITDETETINFSAKKGKLTAKGVLIDSVIIPDKLKDMDYSLFFDNEGYLNIVSLGDNLTGNIEVTYNRLNPEAVTGADIIGGYDLQNDRVTGLELTDEIYSRFRLIPGLIIAPKFSAIPSVAALMASKANNINGMFKALAIADLSDSTITNYTEAPEFKNSKSLNDKNLFLTYGMGKIGDKTYHLSTLAASLTVLTDSENGGIPFVSPSNNNLKIEALITKDPDGQEKNLYLSLEKANYLNGEGIATAINFNDGWKLWGIQTAAFPGSGDIKDNSYPVRRMFNWINNNIILTLWQKVDRPQHQRQIDSVIDSVNIWLNGLTASEAILGGRLEFKPEENPTTDLTAGIYRFHLYIAPPNAMRNLDFIIEYDTNYLTGGA